MNDVLALPVDVRPVAGEGVLSWDRTVPRHLVHRRSTAEVLLTDAVPLTDGRFLVAAQWPLRHSSFRPDPEGRHDPVFAAETIRQIGLLVPRTFLGCPDDLRLLIRTIGFRLDPATEPRAAYGASDILCDVEVTDVRQGRAAAWPLALGLRIGFAAHGVAFGHAEGRLRAVPAAQYDALRAGRVQDPPIRPDGDRPTPAEVGVAGTGGVLLRRDPTGALLVDPADLRHPLFFDHPSDHISGMALLEAARQAACLTRGSATGRLVESTMRAKAFTEWAPDARVECVGTGGGWAYDIVQGDVVTATGTLRFAD